MWLRNNGTELRVGMLLAFVGVPLSLGGAFLYTLPEPAFPLLYIGLSCLFTGLAMVGANTSGRRRR